MENSCHKTKYATQKHADEDIERIRKKSQRPNIPIRSYFCHLCIGWHLTSKEHFAEKELVKLNAMISQLKEEIKNLKDTDRREFNAKADLQLKRDKQLKKLQDQCSADGKTISRLRQDNSELISQIVKFQSLKP